MAVCTEIWLHGLWGVLILISGKQVIQKMCHCRGWLSLGWRKCKTKEGTRVFVFLTVSSSYRLTDRKKGACRPQQSCSRAWGNTAPQTCNQKHTVNLINLVQKKKVGKKGNITFNQYHTFKVWHFHWEQLCSVVQAIYQLYEVLNSLLA